MQLQQKICHRVPIKCDKERQIFRKREEKHIEGTPQILLGKFENGLLEVWAQDIKATAISKLKEFNSSEKALQYARRIIVGCCGLARVYGFFMINQNMIFLTPEREIVAWINPDIMLNQVKIYLPNTKDGELSMIRSIVSYFKLWLKIDHQLLLEATKMDELPSRFDAVKFKPCQSFRAKSPDRQFMANRRNSVNIEGELHFRYQQEGVRMPAHGGNLLADNKSSRQVIGRSPGRESDVVNFLTTSLSNKYPLKFNSSNEEAQKNKTTLVSEKGEEFEHRTFNNMNSNIIANKSVGPKTSSNYFPNKTTSNKNHIVSLINKLDDNPNIYTKNRLLDDDHDHNRDRLKKMKQSLDGIGEELDGLFHSTMQNEEENQQTIKQMSQQFSNLLD